MHRMVRKCWSCGNEFTVGHGFSIDGSGYDHVCWDCWDQIPVTNRLWLAFFFRNAADGGAGLKELFENAVNEYDVFREIGRRPESEN